jgi:hypothetical protein
MGWKPSPSHSPACDTLARRGGDARCDPSPGQRGRRSERRFRGIAIASRQSPQGPQLARAVVAARRGSASPTRMCAARSSREVALQLPGQAIGDRHRPAAMVLSVAPTRGEPPRLRASRHGSRPECVEAEQAVLCGAGARQRASRHLPRPAPHARDADGDARRADARDPGVDGRRQHHRRPRSTRTTRRTRPAASRSRRRRSGMRWGCCRGGGLARGSDKSCVRRRRAPGRRPVPRGNERHRYGSVSLAPDDVASG